MYDIVSGTSHHEVAHRWWYGWFARHYMPAPAGTREGLNPTTMYYDPKEDYNHKIDATMGLGTAWYALPQAPDLARALYEAAVVQEAWRDASKPIKINVARVRRNTLGMLVARELGDHLVADRLEAALAPVLEPREFGEDEFGWFLHLGEKWPRGQLNSLLIINDLITKGGEWRAAFDDAEHAKRFYEPTVVGVDFPTLGIEEAANTAGVLTVATYVGTASAAGSPTEFKIINVPTRQPTVVCDGAEHHDWSLGNDGVLAIRSDVAAHRFEIRTGELGESEAKL